MLEDGGLRSEDGRRKAEDGRLRTEAVAICLWFTFADRQIAALVPCS
jgi:hypothetical protein